LNAREEADVDLAGSIHDDFVSHLQDRQAGRAQLSQSTAADGREWIANRDDATPNPRGD
jgi:hypothetical protein